MNDDKFDLATALFDNVFPLSEQKADQFGNVVEIKYPGLTKRELFAALIMPALLTCKRRFGGEEAEEAVVAADALLAELDATKP